MLPYLLIFCRLSLALLFAYSFVGKLRDVAGFAQTISRFKLLPPSWSRGTAWLFLGSEGAVVLLLLLGGQLLPQAFGLAIFLLLAFTVALISVLVRNIQTTCNCFGKSQTPVTYRDVWRNFGLMSVCGLGLGLTSFLQPGLATQNWLAISWQSLGFIRMDNRLLATLVLSNILAWCVLLVMTLYMILFAKRLRQLNPHTPKEYILQEARRRYGEPAPQFQAQNLAGKIVTLDSFKGKDVAFIFLSPGCPPCIERIPALNDYYRQGKAGGMELVIVNVDHHMSAEMFVQQHNVQLPTLWAPQANNPFAQAYDADSTPSFCLVDAAQRIRANGFLDARYWPDQLALMWS